MKFRDSYQWRRQLMTGLILIGVGALFMLDREDVLEIGTLWHYSMLLLVALGLNRMIGAPTGVDFSQGLWHVFTGLWLFAVFENLYGMTFQNSWPALIIGWGITLVLRPLIKGKANRTTEAGNDK